MKGRRFIAGAVCPKCAAVDRIVVEDDGRRRRCIACGFTDELPAGRPPTAPRGKLDDARPRRASRLDDSVADTTVRIVPRRTAQSKTDEDDSSSA